MSIRNDLLEQIRDNVSGGLTPEQESVLDTMTYNSTLNRVVCSASFESLPSSLFLGDGMRISNAVEALSLETPSNKEAVSIMNRFSRTDGSRSNPIFYALSSLTENNIELDTSQVLASPVERVVPVSSDFAFIGFKFRPNTAGTLHAEYWMQVDGQENKIIDATMEVTQAQVDANTDVEFISPNPILVYQGVNLRVRLSGINFKGSATLPRYITQTLPFEEIQINGHTEYVISDINPVFIGCDYQVNTTTGGVTLTIPLVFNDAFTVQDSNSSFSNTNPCTVDFSAFTYPAGTIKDGQNVGGQNVGSAVLQNPKDAFKFYWDGELWRFKNLQSKGGGIV